MRINYNVSAMLSNNALANNDSLLAKSLQRLSTGMKINNAKDNPSGLAMAKRMNAQIEGLSIANQNAGDGISVIEIADGAMTEISEMLQRMNELSVKAANGIMSDGDRAIVQEEVAQLKEEITRVAETAEFNGQPLLNGEFSLKGYTDNIDIKVNSYSPEVEARIYNMNEFVIEREVVNGEETGGYTINATLGAEFPEGAIVSIQDNLVTIKGSNSFEMKLDVTALNLGALDENTPSVTVNDLQIDATGIGAMRLQIGANEGQILAVDIPAITLQNMSIEEIDVSTKEGAEDAIKRLNEAINYLSGVRGSLGAYQNRLESTINSLGVTSENMTSAYSRIMDVDMAEEMTQYTTAQVLTQAGTSMLAQTNERPSQVLQLLQ